MEALPAGNAHHLHHHVLCIGLTKVRQIGQPKIAPFLNWSKLIRFGVFCGIWHLQNTVLIVGFHLTQKSLSLLIWRKSYSGAKVAPFFFPHTVHSSKTPASLAHRSCSHETIEVNLHILMNPLVLTALAAVAGARVVYRRSWSYRICAKPAFLFELTNTHTS